MLYHTFSSQEEINKEYNPRLIVAGADELIKSYFTESERVIAEFSNHSGVVYGQSREETLDIFPSKIKSSSIHIFFHGGYWHSLTSRDFAFVAEGLVRNGISAVLVNYALCPTVKIDEIVRQSRAAVAWTYQNAKTFGGNPERISISGHSAGGHLTGMMLTAEWEKDYGLPTNIIKGLLPISGLFDLAPFPFSWLQSVLQLTPEEVLRNSPLLLKPLYSPPVIVAVGADESQEFKRQSEVFTKFLQKYGVPAEFQSIPGKNHFNIINDFLGNGGLLCKNILEWK